MNTNEEKSALPALIFLLIIVGGFCVYYFVLVPLVFDKPEEELEVDDTPTEEELLVLEAERLFEAFSLTLEEEYIYTNSDLEGLMGTLSTYRMSNQLRVFTAIKNVDEGYITRDHAYNEIRARENIVDGFMYTGWFIMAEPITRNLENLFGAVPFNHESISLLNTRYVYNSTRNRYDIWTRLQAVEKSEVQKFVHKETILNRNQIVIYMYLAYTDFTDEDYPISRTFNTPSIAQVITEDNVSAMLRHMDRFRYTFIRSESGDFYFKSIEFVRD